VHSSDVMILDSPWGDFMENSSSSYGLSLFSLRVGSRHDEGAGAVPAGSPSISIEELWSGIDQLDDARPVGTSTAAASSPRSGSGSGRVGEGTSHAREGVVGALGLLTSALPRGYGRGSARDMTMWILADATSVVLPRMRRSFVDRQYSPSTSMDGVSGK
jgi:hypothetical protein